MTETVEVPKLEIKPFVEIQATIAELKEENAAKTFDYDTKEGNKLARSHVTILKKKKAVIEKVRKAEKAQSLEYGRAVDSQAKELTAHVVEMIDVHQVPLDKVKAHDEARIAGLEIMVNAVRLPEILPATSAETQTLHDEISQVTVDERFAEKQGEAQSEKEHTLKVLAAHVVNKKTEEADAVELAQHRKEKSEREEAEAKRNFEETEEREAKEAEEKAAAEEKQAKFVYEEKQRLDEEAEGRRAEAEAKRIKEAEDRAAVAAKKEIDDNAKAEKEAEAKRKADVAHKAKIIDEVAEALMKEIPTLGKGVVLTIASVIAEGKIAHTSIKF